MKKTTVHTETICWDISIIQHGSNRFTVTYGAEIWDNLTYSEAARKYGEAVFHALAYEGKLDNRDAS